MTQHAPAFWSLSVTEMLQQLQTAPEGLTGHEARRRLALYGSNRLKPPKRSDVFTLLFAQFKSPLILILLLATGLSFFLRDPVDAFIILTIVVVSGLLGFWQERGATNAVQKLLAIVQIKASVLRDKDRIDIPVEEIVPGDIVLLSAGDVVPGDAAVQESKDLFVDEAMLTGEAFPVEKAVAVLPADTPLGQRTNALWMGTHVVSGAAKALVVGTGKETEFGKVSERLRLRPQETDFERGIRQFGFFLMEITLVLVVAIFAINVYLARPVLDSFLFSLALAVGLTPQLLPAIISINLAHGAKRMAQAKVIVKRLASIENFGSMNVICSDKTGTLTEGIVRLQSALDVEGAPSDKVLFHAYLNALYETGFTNPIDEAIRTHRSFDLSAYRKADEIPYDFLRKRLSILVAHQGTYLMVTKGALANVLSVCSTAETSAGAVVDIAAVRDRIERNFEAFSSQGFRTLGVAYRNLGTEPRISKESEAGMTFLGFLVLSDPPKANIIETIAALKRLGVSLKIITGDNHLVAANVSQQMGLSNTRILTGPDLRRLSDEALLGRVVDVDVFAEIEPNQKERIILALRKAGNVVGYMGDGINDASALHSADVGISVDSAADVAKEAADLVLLEHNLDVVHDGIIEGRRTVENVTKYILMGASSNFGNMFSMAGAALFLPFLPMLPTQVLLNNLLYDISEVGVPFDNVDAEAVRRPVRWDIRFIERCMLLLGPVSSLFDFITFFALLRIFGASEPMFQTGWFVESLATQCLVIFVIRTRKAPWRSLPNPVLTILTLGVVLIGLVFPLTPLGPLFGFREPPAAFYLFLVLAVAAYLLLVEGVKRLLYRRARS